MMVAEFTGQLIGGPNDGNLVTSSVARIPYECEDRWWLDGSDSPPTIAVTRGTYIWDEDKNYFKWERHGIGFNPHRVSI